MSLDTWSRIVGMAAHGQERAKGQQTADPVIEDPSANGAVASAPDGEGEFDERRAKLERLREEGIDPYPPVTLWETRTRIADVLAAHHPDELEEGGHPELRYQVAGRIISRREHPSTSFLDLRDLSGSIQIVVRLDDLGENTYKRILGLDIGDIVGVEGFIYKTKRGQLVLAVGELTLLTKTLRPPPDKHHGLADTGTRYS